MTQKKVIGIDFGGTKIKLAVVAEDGKIHGEEILLATESNRPAKDIVETMRTGVIKAATSAELSVDDLSGIGIGSPGPLDLKNGIILDTPNLPTMKNFPLKNAISELFNLPVELNNDGNCFVLGEAYFGAGKNAPTVCGVTLGTGFGCGIVFGKHIYIGATGTAAEVWCSPYADLNFEEYGSGRTLVRLYEQKTGEKLGAKEIYHLAQNNNLHAQETFFEFGENLGRILSIMVNLLDPDVFVVGGSISNAWEFFKSPLLENLKQNINDEPRAHIHVQRSLLGDNSGLLGAAALLFS